MPTLKALADAMLETMYDADGIGLRPNKSAKPSKSASWMFAHPRAPTSNSITNTMEKPPPRFCYAACPYKPAG
jgi:hypothetical protein